MGGERSGGRRDTQSTSRKWEAEEADKLRIWEDSSFAGHNSVVSEASEREREGEKEGEMRGQHDRKFPH